MNKEKKRTNDTFGGRLRNMRNKRGLTSQQLFDEIFPEEINGDLTEAAKKKRIGSWERDDNRPDINALASLCKVLGCLAWILVLLRTYRLYLMQLACQNPLLSIYKFARVRR